MSEDVAEPRFSWRKSIAAVVAVLGAALGVASLFGEWSRAVRFDGTTVPAWRFSTLGPCAIFYVILLVGLVAAVTKTLFGHHRVGATGARNIGIIFSVALALVLGALATMFVRESPTFEFRSGSCCGNPQILGWGIYAAFGAVAALGAAIVLHPRDRSPGEPIANNDPTLDGDAD
jgi:hypothetical protein